MNINLKWKHNFQAGIRKRTRKLKYIYEVHVNEKKEVDENDKQINAIQKEAAKVGSIAV